MFRRILVLVVGLALCSQNAFAADVTGTVKFEGAVPQMKPLDMSTDPDCQAKHTTPPVAEALVLGDGNTMANVFVRVKSGLPEKQFETPKEPIIIRQHGCVYEPHVVGVMAGQPVKFLNDDGLMHNVHALPKTNKPFNLSMPASMKEAEKNFTEEEWMFPIKCDVHPWMLSYAAIMKHPFFSVTSKDGRYSIKGLEPGTYEIEIWHEKLGTKVEKVTISGNETKTVDFVMQRPS